MLFSPPECVSHFYFNIGFRGDKSGLSTGLLVTVTYTDTYTCYFIQRGGNQFTIDSWVLEKRKLPFAYRRNGIFFPSLRG